MVLTLQERIFIVENVLRKGGKYTKEVQELFQKKFGAERLPHRNCVSALLHKFKETGSVQDKPKTGRPKVVTDTVLQNVTNKLQRSPRKSLRRLSQETRISLTSTHRAVHQLKFFPYKVHVVHELKPQDSEKRVLFCRWFENFILEKGENILNHTFFSDEAWFHLSGYMNSQNSRAWSTVNPHALFQKPLHDQKVGVWCALSRGRIIGPIFFENTITSKRYIHNILEPFFNQLTEQEKQQGWFQKDGATAHTASVSMAAVGEVFGDRVIFRGLWPPRSPDLTPPDFYLWGKLKGSVYADNPRTTDELKQKITSVIQNTQPDELGRVFQNTQRRARLCLQVNGAHFLQLL